MITPMRSGDGAEKTTSGGNDLGESTSARLRETQQALAASQADLTTAKQQRDEALHSLAHADSAIAQLDVMLTRVRTDRDAVSLIADMLRAELTSAQQENQRLRDADACVWQSMYLLCRAQLDDAIAHHSAEIHTQGETA